MLAEFNRVVLVPNEVDSNVSASDQVANHIAPIPQGPGSKMQSVFFQMMNEWFSKFVRANPVAP